MPSTVIASFSYLPEAKSLQVTFVSGIIYHYHDVPETVYESLKNAWSKGSYFNRFIKNRYFCHRAPDRPSL